MGIILLALISLISIISLYGYLKIVYECVRKVKISKNTNLLTKKSTTTTTTTSNGKIGALSMAVDSELKTAIKTSPLETDIRIEEFKQAPGPLPWPIIGNLNLLGRYEFPFQAFTALAKQFGDVYSLTLGTTRCLIVNNLDLIREVLNQNGKYFGGRPDFLRFHVLFGGDRNNSLALCDWSQLQQKRRNLARKHCSPRDASSFFQKMSDVGCFEVQEFVQRLHDTITPGEEFPLKPIIQQTCANMFTQYMSSVRFDYDDKEFQLVVRCFDEIFWDINQGYAVDFLPWLSPFYANHMKRIVHWSETIRKFILNRIINEREHLIDVEQPEKDFTDALLKSLAEDEEVSRETIIFMLEDFIGGHSAIGNLVMLALAYILRNPETGIKIQQEADNLIGNSKRSITLHDIERMPYTVATIYEVLRYSSSPIVPHVATEDVAIAGYGVTKGTIVFINNYELNTNPKYWDKPEKFNPDRFIETLSSSSTSSSPPSREMGVRLKKNIPHFLPFSIGKRTCIGQNLVKGFGFILLANIMHRYNVSCKNLETIKTYTACVAVPPDTFSLSLTPRFTTQ